MSNTSLYNFLDLKEEAYVEKLSGDLMEPWR
jgi:hypothetical protein